jgi:hypothetical protein
MLDSVVLLTEKFAELLKYRSERRAKRFEKLVQPTYEALKVVHKDYVQMFEETASDIESGEALSTVARSLKKRRIEEEAERHAVLAQAQEFADEPSLADLWPFFEAVSRYFHVTPFSGNNTPSSLLVGFLQEAALQESGAGAAEATRKAPPATPASSVLSEIERSGTDKASQKLESAKTRERLKTGTELSVKMLRANWEEVSTAYAKLRAASVD